MRKYAYCHGDDEHKENEHQLSIQVLVEIVSKRTEQEGNVYGRIQVVDTVLRDTVNVPKVNSGAGQYFTANPLKINGTISQKFYINKSTYISKLIDDNHQQVDEA